MNGDYSQVGRIKYGYRACYQMHSTTEQCFGSAVLLHLIGYPLKLGSIYRGELNFYIYNGDI
jgi:hypothetical protein